MQIAILDDYQNVALTFADWSRVASQADITVFNDHLSEPAEDASRPDRKTRKNVASFDEFRQIGRWA